VTDYLAVTETPGVKASAEQIERLYHRYHFARQYCHGKDVLEAACGAGQGLGYLAKVAKSVAGTDIDEKCLAYARKTYADRPAIVLQQRDAESTSFEDGSLDVVILYEAIYYLEHPEKFIDNGYRMLRPGGVLIICSVNREWTDFNPSPYSKRYYSAKELYDLLKTRFANVQLSAAFSDESGSLKEKIISSIKRAAVTLHIIPKTMKGKELLKRVFFGRLVPLPAEVREDMTDYTPPSLVRLDTPDMHHKVIYAAATK
jgi:ubiquinone/menaquinone biosynthesis C-methylase UbiE